MEQTKLRRQELTADLAIADGYEFFFSCTRTSDKGPNWILRYFCSHVFICLASCRWKGGWNIKLEGSDHAPVYTSLVDIPDVSQHSTSSLAARYLPMIHGLLQTLVSVLMRRQAAKQVESHEESSSFSDETTILGGCSHSVKRSVTKCSVPGTDISCCSLDQDSENTILNASDHSEDLTVEATCTIAFDGEYGSTMLNKETRKRARKSQQLSLRSFFQKSPNLDNGVDSSATDISTNQTSVLNSNNQSQEAPVMDGCGYSSMQNDTNGSASSQGQEEQDCPTFGCRFYVCARAEGPSSNPEANCGFFRWASMKSRPK
ncbi:hypothetical protein REPUB_Repub09cG0197500 [Reevesia pubescens]